MSLGDNDIPQRYRDMGFTRVGEKKTSSNPDKKWMVLAQKGDKFKVVHGGYKGMQDFTQHKDEKRRTRFWQRMGGENSPKTKDVFSPLYWHKKFGTWEDGGTIEFSFGGRVFGSRLGIPNVRGGWTQEKIIKYLKSTSSDVASTYTLLKYISDFENWQQLKNHIYYHGTTNYFDKGLKPSITFSERFAENQGGGGYGQRYFGISLTKRKRTAESFSGMSDGVSIYPVILKRDATVIERTDLKDASEIEDIIVDLYEKGVDAVWIGGGEEELVVVNPNAILLYKKGSDYYSVYGGFKSVALTDEQIKEIYENAKPLWDKYSSLYKNATSKEERDAVLRSIDKIQFQNGGSVSKSKYRGLIIYPY